MLPASPATSSRICRSCRLEKPSSDYYPKRGGLEARCKVCKMSERKERYKRSHASPAEITAQPAPQPDQAEQITSSKENRPNPPHIEPEQGNAFWDMKYGRPLTEEEHREIRFNLMALLNVLDEKEAR